MTDRTEAGLRATIEALIDAGTSGDLSGLERIYHPDMKILMIDPAGTLTRFDKPKFMEMLASTMQDTNPDDHKWARFDAIEVNQEHGHVLITRKVPLAGDKAMLTLSIDLLDEDDRWQVTREVIVIQPDPDHAQT